MLLREVIHYPICVAVRSLLLLTLFIEIIKTVDLTQGAYFLLILGWKDLDKIEQHTGSVRIKTFSDYLAINEPLVC